MKKKHLEKNLENWIQAQIITSEQADKIRALEEKNLSPSYKFVTGLLTIGVITLLLGCISFIASNWNFIPDSIKLTVDFLILTALSFFSFLFWKKKKPLYFEMFLLAFMLFCLASIGLISQIYNTGGELSDALLFWSLIVLPVMLLSQKKITPFLWLVGFYGGLFYALKDSLFFISEQAHRSSLFLFLPLTSAVLSLASDFFSKNEERTKILWGWSFCFFIFSFFYRESVFTYDNSSLPVDFLSFGYILSYLCAFILYLYLAFSSSFEKKDKAFLMLFLLCFIFPIHIVALILGFLVLSLTLLKKGYERLFRWLLILIQLRLLVFFIAASAGLLSTAVNLIVYGAVFIVISLLWLKYSLSITQWFRRWA